jgi:hypothetical protein
MHLDFIFLKMKRYLCQHGNSFIRTGISFGLFYCSHVNIEPIRQSDRSRTLVWLDDTIERLVFCLFIACWANSPSNTLPSFPIPYMAIVDDWVSDITCCEEGVVCQ